jgi:MFS family permease
MESTVEQSYPLEKPLMTRAFLVLLLTQTCFGMSFSAFFLVPKYLKLALAASDLEIGTLSALGAAAGVFAFPIVGSLNDRFGRKRFILFGSVLITMTALAMLKITQVGFAIYAVRMLQGVAFALLFNSATTLVSDKVHPEHLGRALAVFGASMLVTNALSPAISEWIADHYGWPAVFWFSAAWASSPAAARR